MHTTRAGPPRVRLPRGSGERGVAMLTALVVIIVLVLISYALVNLAMSEYSTAAIVDRSTQAFLAAEAGGELAIAVLRPQADWSGLATSASWQPLHSNVPFPAPAPGAIGQFTVYLRHPAGEDPRVNISIRSTGRVRGATRTIEFDLHRLGGADFATYSVRTVDITKISGGGSLQFHGSAYFEGNLILKGAAQAGFFNDRYVSMSDAPQYLNHLYVQGTLDTSTGNPTIGSPYYWVHVGGSLIGAGNNFNVSNLDKVVPPPFYPNVIDETVRAFRERGNLLDLSGAQAKLVLCRWTAGGWVPDTSGSNLILNGTTSASTFFLPPATANPATPCAGFGDTISEVRGGGQFSLMWDAASTVSQMVFRNDAKPVYIPGKVQIFRDIRYEGQGTIVVGNQPGASIPMPPSPSTPHTLLAQPGCALDFNGDSDCGAAKGNYPGYQMLARISPCSASPGTDNPASTYARRNPQGLGPDLAVIVVNGSAHSDLNANTCNQEMNLVVVVGDRGATDAKFTLVKKLQWYGFLMTREMGLGQVPDFWQMPDISMHLPEWSKSLIYGPSNVVVVRNWKELY